MKKVSFESNFCIHTLRNQLRVDAILFTPGFRRSKGLAGQNYIFVLATMLDDYILHANHTVFYKSYSILVIL